MDIIRILHVSDLHISSRPQTSGSFLRYHLQKRSLVERFSRPASEQRMKALMRTAQEHAPGCDAILITGDLANSGDREDLETARLFCDGSYTPRATRDLGIGPLDAAGLPIFLFPGNHDRYSGRRGAGGEVFDQIFEPYWSVGQGAEYRVIRNTLGIVMGDLTLGSPGEAGSWRGQWGQGRAARDRVAFMVAETRLLRAEYAGIAVIWAVHFPPAFTNLDEDLVLLEEERLIEAAEAEGIGLLLCGHTHEHRPPYPVGPKGIVQVLCVGSACQQNPNDNTLYLLDLDIDGGALADFRYQTLVYVPLEGRFLPL